MPQTTNRLQQQTRRELSPGENELRLPNKGPVNQPDSSVPEGIYFEGRWLTGNGRYADIYELPIILSEDHVTSSANNFGASVNSGSPIEELNVSYWSYPSEEDLIQQGVRGLLQLANADNGKPPSASYLGLEGNYEDEVDNEEEDEDEDADDSCDHLHALPTPIDENPNRPSRQATSVRPCRRLFKIPTIVTRIISTLHFLSRDISTPNRGHRTYQSRMAPRRTNMWSR